MDIEAYVTIISIIFILGIGIVLLTLHLDHPRQVECYELEKIATLYGNLTSEQKETVFDKCNHDILKIEPLT